MNRKTEHLPLLGVGPIYVISIVLLTMIGIMLTKSSILNTGRIKTGQFVITGVYKCVRNPIYTAFMFVCTGVVFFMNNLWLLMLPVVFWIYLTVLMKNTEEKWLIKLYGQKYLDYCKCTNRCIPWFPKRR